MPSGYGVDLHRCDDHALPGRACDRRLQRAHTVDGCGGADVRGGAQRLRGTSPEACATNCAVAVARRWVAWAAGDPAHACSASCQRDVRARSPVRAHPHGVGAAGRTSRQQWQPLAQSNRSQLWIAKCAGAAADQQFDWDGPLIRQRQVRRARSQRRPTGAARPSARLLCSARGHTRMHTRTQARPVRLWPRVWRGDRP